MEIFNSHPRLVCLGNSAELNFPVSWCVWLFANNEPPLVASLKKANNLINIFSFVVKLHPRALMPRQDINVCSLSMVAELKPR